MFESNINVKMCKMSLVRAFMTVSCIEMSATLGIADGWGRNSEKICTWTYKME